MSFIIYCLLLAKCLGLRQIVVSVVQLKKMYFLKIGWPKNERNSIL